MRHSTVAASMIVLLVSTLYAGSIAPVSRAQEATPRLEELPAIAVTFSKAWSSGDPEQLAAIYAENALFEEVVLGGAVTQSRDELRAYAAAVYAAFPNFTATPVSAFVSDNRARRGVESHRDLQRAVRPTATRHGAAGRRARGFGPRTG